MAVFLHPSALLEVYVQDAGTRAMHEILARPDLDGQLYLSDIVGLAIPAALGALRRDRTLSATSHARALSEFLRDYPGAFHVRRTTPEIVEIASELALRRAVLHRLPPGEVLQLAAAMEIGRMTQPEPIVFLARDTEMLTLARSVGFDTFDPARDRADWLRPLRLDILEE